MFCSAWPCWLAAAASCSFWNRCLASSNSCFSCRSFCNSRSLPWMINIHLSRVSASSWITFSTSHFWRECVSRYASTKHRAYLVWKVLSHSLFIVFVTHIPVTVEKKNEVFWKGKNLNWQSEMDRSMIVVQQGELRYTLFSIHSSRTRSRIL